MGYLGSQATFTGTQNNKRVSVIATAGQIDFLPAGGYSIGAIDVYRNGVKLAQNRDFSALDGVTVTLQQAANANDILEFVVFENFAVNDVITGDGDSTIRGNLQVSGDLSITGTLNATVSNTLTAGIATEAIRAGMSTNSTRAGIATQVSGFLGVGVTGTNLNVTGVITASSFSGDGSALTGIASTDDVSTNGLVVAGISTLAGATFSGVTTHSANNVFNSTVSFNDNATFGDDDKIVLGDGGGLEIYHSGTNSIIRDNGSGNLTLASNGNAVRIVKNLNSEDIARFNTDGSVELYYDNSKKFETTGYGVTISGGLNVSGITTFQDNVNLGDDDVLNFGASSDGRIFFQNSENEFHVRVPGGTGKLTLGAGPRVQITNEDGNTNRAVFTNSGVVITGVCTATSFSASAKSTLTGVGFTGFLREGINIVSGKLSDNTTINIDHSMAHYFTTTETTTGIPNFTSTAGINTDLSVGETFSVNVITTAATAGYSTGARIDAGSTLSVLWNGGDDPSEGGDGGVDVYTYQVIKTGDAAFTVLGNVSNFA